MQDRFGILEIEVKVKGQISLSHVYLRNSLSLEANTIQIWNP